MTIKTDRYTKIILTVIAVTLICILFRPELQTILRPQAADALTRIPGVVDDNGNTIMLTDVYVRNTDGVPVPIKTVGKVQVFWDKPMPVYIADTTTPKAK